MGERFGQIVFLKRSGSVRLKLGDGYNGIFTGASEWV